MNRRSFLKSTFIFTAGLWLPKSGIVRPAEGRGLMVMGGGVPAAGPSYLYSQDFEGGSLPAGWDNYIGTPTWNATPPAGCPVSAGTYSLRTPAAAAQVIARYDYGSVIPISYTQFWMYIDEEGDTSRNYATGRATDGSQVWVISQRSRAAGGGLVFDAYTNNTLTYIGSWATDVLDDWVKVEVKYDASGLAYAWYASLTDTLGSAIHSGNVTGTPKAGIQYVYLGVIGADTADVYFDLFKIDEDLI